LKSREGQPTPQALAVISALEDSQKKGLNPEDYDASQWPARVVALKAGSANADTVAQFDAALTISAMRYLSNLRIGRLSPKPRSRHPVLPAFRSSIARPTNASVLRFKRHLTMTPARLEVRMDSLLPFLQRIHTPYNMPV
jgi:hypothetical protein